MRKTRFALPWSAGALLVGVLASGCATATPSAEDGLRLDPGIARFTGQEQRDRADSARAQRVADEVGPRVTVTADFDYAGGARQVQASFHMYDDAYVVVGHLDAAGRMKIVFPSRPGDDGFVRGDKIYRVPTFFAGFADEYAWRQSDYRYRYHSIDSRNDSYDAGLGYVFVVASWRPMRLDRIADGNRWQTYDVSDISYMQDPREAIEELGSVIAGDNREAYTIQYAHYTTTNYGTYAFSDFDAVNSGCYGALGFLGFPSRSMFFTPFSLFSPYGLGFGYGGCADSYGPSYGYYNPYGYYSYGYGFPGYTAPGFRPPVIPIGTPIFHRPTVASAVAWHKPESGVVSSAPMGSGTTNGVSAYHRPGLITEDAPGPRGQGRGRETNAQMRGVSIRPEVPERPNIQQMVGHRRVDDGGRSFDPRAGASPSGSGWAQREPSWANRGSEANRPRENGGTYRGQGGRNAEGPRNSPTYNTPSYSSPRSQPSRMEPRSSPRAEPSHSAPPRAEPAARPSPPRSSSGSKKP